MAPLHPCLLQTLQPPKPNIQQAYLAGRWGEARAGFEALRTARRDARGAAVEDGPARALLAVMAASGFEAPAGWPGYRELTEK